MIVLALALWLRLGCPTPDDLVTYHVPATGEHCYQLDDLALCKQP